ncbi:histidine kinase famiy protein [Microvirga pudoricolor]|uniref:histidine kinase famiy protein n=1 Tax=Microvirga pudoricolor TaxID=2778729 RepID=UPI001950021D|nr:histidine kinase famiy protein [Microvirga pudoricolor]MBM6592394.1 PAS domain-containing protein [Microvirga pudoricolor]
MVPDKDDSHPETEDAAGETQERAGDGQSFGVVARGMPDHHSFSPTGEKAELHWQKSYISRPGLEDRGDVFFAAVEMTRMPMIVTDPKQDDNPIVFANGAFLDLTGYDEQEILGRNCRFLQGAKTDRQVVADIREAIRDRRAIAVEILNYKRDGSPFWNALFMGPVFDTDGELIYFFASQLDVTRRRTSEQAFRQAQKMEAIGQLTAGLAHDFNNLLQVMAGNVDMARQHIDGDRARLAKALEGADRAAEQASKLTQQLLSFARKTRLEPRPTNLNTLVVAFSDMLSRTLGGSVDLRLDLKPRTPACTVDPTHMEMALLNVLINARDAMPEGGVVTVSTEPLHLNGNAPAHHLQPGDYAVMSVSDQGSGMTPDVLERATEPFFSTKGPGKGTGLGLAMVHGFVQQSGGRLEIVSEPGKGTTVRMIFPVASDKVEDLPEPAPEPETSGRRGVETVLVVDDSDDVRDLAEAILADSGYAVVAARSGEDALAVLNSGTHVDLLFTDLVMPGGMNGLVLAEQVHEMMPELPILVTTGYTEELVAQGPGTPTMDVLGKPYRRADLLDRVRAALNRGGRVFEARSSSPRHEG